MDALRRTARSGCACLLCAGAVVLSVTNLSARPRALIALVPLNKIFLVNHVVKSLGAHIFVL
jgi:hypothetical protein